MLQFQHYIPDPSYGMLISVVNILIGNLYDRRTRAYPHMKNAPFAGDILLLQVTHCFLDIKNFRMGLFKFFYDFQIHIEDW